MRLSHTSIWLSSCRYNQRCCRSAELQRSIKLQPCIKPTFRWMPPSTGCSRFNQDSSGTAKRKRFKKSCIIKAFVSWRHCHSWLRSANSDLAVTEASSMTSWAARLETKASAVYDEIMRDNAFKCYANLWVRRTPLTFLEQKLTSAELNASISLWLISALTSIKNGLHSWKLHIPGIIVFLQWHFRITT